MLQTLEKSYHLDSLLSLPEAKRNQIIDELSEHDAGALLYDWASWARKRQLPPPGDWRIWLLLAGRGFGKTRTGAEWVRWRIESGMSKRVALVAPIASDARDVMVEGESGIMACCPPWDMPRYEPTKRRLTWPNGAMATTYSADEPDRLRGPQHDAAWCDELASWRRPEAWDMLLLGLRLGQNPQAVITTTPKPLPHIKALLADDTVHVTRGSTFDNRANLAPAFFHTIINRYEGTRLGQQEIYAQILDDAAGALWNRNLLEDTRVTQHPDLHRIVVAVDPAASSGNTGIVVVGVGEFGGARHCYVLDDVTTPAGAKPAEWGAAAVTAYHKWRADCVVAEVNNGGDMIESVIRNVSGGENIPYKVVRATRGKRTRAEPISALWEQGRGHMVGMYLELEDQLCSWEPGDASPDRLDAMVWAVTELDYNAVRWADVAQLGQVENFESRWA